MSQLSIVEIDEELMRLASDTAEEHGLRGYDAMHLAAAHCVGADVFSSADRRLRCRECIRFARRQPNRRRSGDRTGALRYRSRQLTGMRNTLLSLDPVRDAELWTAVNAKLASLRQADGTNETPWAQLQVDAFISTVASGDAVARVPQVGVLIDYQTIPDGLHANSICELDKRDTDPGFDRSPPVLRR